jgi:hypothetical protein
MTRTSEQSKRVILSDLLSCLATLNEMASSENPMVTLKPEIKRNNNTQTLTRREQVIVSRLRMGYTA